MAGMLALGREYNLVPEASGVALSMKNCSAIGYLIDTSGACTLTVLGGAVFGTVATAWQPSNGFGQAAYTYQCVKADGTAAWTKVAASWSNNVLTCTGTNHYLTYVEFYCSQAADGYPYIKATASAANSTVAILHDLLQQRTPANLTIPGA